MSWAVIKVSADGADWIAHKSSTQSVPTFSIPYPSGVTEGSTFMASGVSYTAINVKNVGGRNEILLVEAKEEESEDDKPTSRRKRNRTSGVTVQHEVDLRLDSADRKPAQDEHSEGGDQAE